MIGFSGEKKSGGNSLMTAQTAAATSRQLRINAELGWKVARANLALALGRLSSAEPVREGAVLRDTVFEDRQGRRTRLETVHFASSADEHLCCIQARITPENHTASVLVRSGIDGTGYNLDRRPMYTEPPPDDPQMKWHKWAKSKHLEEVAREQLAEGIYLETRTIDTGITIGYAASTIPI